MAGFDKMQKASDDIVELVEMIEQWAGYAVKDKTINGIENAAQTASEILQNARLDVHELFWDNGQFRFKDGRWV